MCVRSKFVLIGVWDIWNVYYGLDKLHFGYLKFDCKERIVVHLVNWWGINKDKSLFTWSTWVTSPGENVLCSSAPPLEGAPTQTASPCAVSAKSCGLTQFSTTLWKMERRWGRITLPWTLTGCVYRLCCFYLYSICSSSKVFYLLRLKFCTKRPAASLRKRCQFNPLRPPNYRWNNFISCRKIKRRCMYLHIQ